MTEKTAEKLGWEMILFTIEQSIDPKLPLDIMELNNGKKYFEIWNPIPDDQHNDVAELFATSANDSVTEYNDKFHYDTKNGFIIMNNEPAVGVLDTTISYHLPSLTIYDADERREFVYAFMKKASFDYSHTHLVEKDQMNYVDFYFQTDRGFINFEFSSYPYTGSMIKFLSWSNNPNPLLYDLSEKEVLSKTFEYGQQTTFSHKEFRGEECQVTLYDKQKDTAKYYLWGKPYYITNVGYCEYPSRQGLGAFFLTVLIDGTTGDHISSKFSGTEG